MANQEDDPTWWDGFKMGLGLSVPGVGDDIRGQAAGRAAAQQELDTGEVDPAVQRALAAAGQAAAQAAVRTGQTRGAGQRGLDAAKADAAATLNAPIGLLAKLRESILSSIGLGDTQGASSRIVGLVRLALLIAVYALIIYLGYRGTRALFGFGSQLTMKATDTGARIGEKLVSASIPRG